MKNNLVFFQKVVNKSYISILLFKRRAHPSVGSRQETTFVE